MLQFLYFGRPDHNEYFHTSLQLSSFVPKYTNYFLSHHYRPTRTIHNQMFISLDATWSDCCLYVWSDLNLLCPCTVHSMAGKIINYLPNINDGTSGIPTWHFPCLIADLWLKCEIVLGAFSRGSTKHRRHGEHIIVVIVVNTASRDV
jgi:hypothetical protein